MVSVIQTNALFAVHKITLSVGWSISTCLLLALCLLNRKRYWRCGVWCVSHFGGRCVEIITSVVSSHRRYRSQSSAMPLIVTATLRSHNMAAPIIRISLGVRRLRGRASREEWDRAYAVIEVYGVFQCGNSKLSKRVALHLSQYVRSKL